MTRSNLQPVATRVLFSFAPVHKIFALMLLCALATIFPRQAAAVKNCDYITFPCPDHYDPPLWPGCPSPPGSQPYTGPDCASCGASEVAMVWWWVSTPTINLRLEDSPIPPYNPSRGPSVNFHLSFRDRGRVGDDDPAIFGVGYGWSFSFKSFL